MGYPIIFETKIVKLSDGRLIHFNLSGCNNDTEGRRRSDWTATLYTKEEFEKKAKSFMKDSKPYKESDGFTMKIGSRYCTEYDYGSHLLRMEKRAITWDELCQKKYVSVYRVDGVTVYDTNGTASYMAADEFSKWINSYYNAQYEILRTPISTEKEIIEALENNKKILIYISK